jgi:hypothetical protein
MGSRDSDDAPVELEAVAHAGSAPEAEMILGRLSAEGISGSHREFR